MCNIFSIKLVAICALSRVLSVVFVFLRGEVQYGLPTRPKLHLVKLYFSPFAAATKPGNLAAAAASRAKWRWNMAGPPQQPAVNQFRTPRCIARRRQQQHTAIQESTVNCNENPICSRRRLATHRHSCRGVSGRGEDHTTVQ